MKYLRWEINNILSSNRNGNLSTLSTNFKFNENLLQTTSVYDVTTLDSTTVDKHAINGSPQILIEPSPYSVDAKLLKDIFNWRVNITRPKITVQVQSTFAHTQKCTRLIKISRCFPAERSWHSSGSWRGTRHCYCCCSFSF